MNAAILRVRAEIAADVRTFEARVNELAALAPLSHDPGLLAQAAVALSKSSGRSP